MLNAGQGDRMRIPRPGDPGYSKRPAFPVTLPAGVAASPAATEGYAWPAYEGATAPSPMAKPGEAWYPSAFGHPNAAGAQDGVRYAYFAGPRRLVVGVGEHTTVYDTGEHVITGIAQRQWDDGGAIRFTSLRGPLSLDQLKVVPM